MIRGRARLDGADEAGGECDDGADEFERSADRNADQAERQQDHPDDRIEHDRNQRSGPAALQAKCTGAGASSVLLPFSRACEDVR